jgi:hypothetical protein
MTMGNETAGIDRMAKALPATERPSVGSPGDAIDALHFASESMAALREQTERRITELTGIIGSREHELALLRVELNGRKELLDHLDTGTKEVSANFEAATAARAEEID